MHSRSHSAGFSLFIVALACVALCGGHAAASETLPLDAQHSSLTFVGEALMHQFRGEAAEITGTATLEPKAAPPVQKATLHFNTAALTTFLKPRDAKMREWLQVTVHPDATFTLENVKPVSGDFKKANPQQPAQFAITGTFELNGIKQPISGQASGWRALDRLIVTGDAIVDTAQFGLPKIRMGFLTVSTKVKTTYRFSFILPPAYELQ